MCSDGASVLRLARDSFLFDLPATLGLFYFLNSCVQSLPMTANTGFLNVELAMPQATQSLYYAVTFMPWSLKPLYGLLADALPVAGYHFRPWLVISSAGSAACYVLMGLWVSTIGGAFLFTLIRAICNACAELMLGAVLVAEARKDKGGNATTLQAAAMGCRYAGTFVSALVGLVLYPCGTQHRRLSDRAVIALTGCLPATVAILAPLLLPERRDPHARVGLDPSAMYGSRGVQLALGLLCVVPLQAAVLWAQACSDTSCTLVSPAVWRRTLYALLATALLLPGLALLGARLAARRAAAAPLLGEALQAAAPAVEVPDSPARVAGEAAGEAPAPPPRAAAADEPDDEPAAEPRSRRALPPLVAVALLLALTATPSAAVQSGSFRYALFSAADRLCDTQYVALVGYAATLASCALVGRAFRARPVRHMVVLGGLLAAATTLVDLPLPLMCAHAPPPHPPPHPPPPPSHPAHPPPPPRPPCDMDAAFGVAAAAAVPGGLAAELGFLPKLVVATEVAAAIADRGGFGGLGGAQCYAVMLMVIDMGDAVSLQVTAPLVARLGITYADFSALPQLILIQAASSAAVLLMLSALWFLPFSPRAALRAAGASPSARRAVRLP